MSLHNPEVSLQCILGLEVHLSPVGHSLVRCKCLRGRIVSLSHYFYRLSTVSTPFTLFSCLSFIFYQSGCFIRKVPNKKIHLISCEINSLSIPVSFSETTTKPGTPPRSKGFRGLKRYSIKRHLTRVNQLFSSAAVSTWKGSYHCKKQLSNCFERRQNVRNNLKAAAQSSLTQKTGKWEFSLRQNWRQKRKHSVHVGQPHGQGSLWFCHYFQTKIQTETFTNFIFGGKRKV